MNKPVVLVVVDGMRPDGLLSCGNPKAKELLARSTVCLNAQTVMPSVTLPCHFSLFHSVPADRHGILTNTYVPQVRPIDGLVERLHASGRSCSFFYNWEELRDLARPGRLAYSFFAAGHANTYERSNEMLTDAAVQYIKDGGSDFVFFYLGLTDHAGHTHGWMSEAYLESISSSIDCICRVMDCLPKDAVTIITADHGGHGRGHGADCPEDMTIPLILHGGPFAAGKTLETASILDVAPTVAALLESAPAEEWEGHCLL